MKIYKLIPITLFVFFSSLASITYAEIIKFGAATYDGEVKKGKAHGIGVFVFTDGSKYEGKVSKNRIHGKGKYTGGGGGGKVYEGKFKYGVLKIKLDKNTRNVIKLKPKTGPETYSEIKGKGNLSNKWFEAEKVSGTYVLSAKGIKDMKAAEAAMKGSGGGGGGGGGGGC